MRKILAVFILFTIYANAYAASLYRHIPFNRTINTGDTITVNYDFSEKSGIRCIADSHAVKVDFTYRGRDKTARLPVSLQAAHVPTKTDEELADRTGQFYIYTQQNSPDMRSYELSCDYLE